MKKLFLFLSFAGFALGQGSTTYLPNGAPNVNPSSPQFCYPVGSCVTRSFTNKLADLLSVRDFGAYGDGVHDDTTAIQNAINAAQVVQSQFIFLPGGNYIISSPLQLNYSAVSLVGENSQITINCSSCSGIQVTTNNVLMRDLVITPASGKTNVTAIEINPTGAYVCDGFHMEDVSLIGSSGTPFLYGLFVHSGLATGCTSIMGTACSTEHTLVQGGFQNYCGQCFVFGDNTSASYVGVNYHHMRDVHFHYAVNAINIVNGAFMTAVGIHSEMASGTAFVIGAFSGNHDNSFVNPELVSGMGTYDLTIGAGANYNMFYTTQVNHSRISDSGTNTSYVSAVELTTGTASISNGHLTTVGALPGISCTGGTGVTASMATGSTDAAGSAVIAGSPLPTSCTMTFAISYVNSPSCTVIYATGGSGMTTTVTAPSIVSSQVSGVPGYKYICLGK